LRIREDIELLNSAATLSHLGDRHAFRPYGIFGGTPARSPRASSIPRAMASGCIPRRRAKSAATISLSLRLSGAGGYGSPAERDPVAISRDVAEGCVSKEAAMRD